MKNPSHVTQRRMETILFPAYACRVLCQRVSSPFLRCLPLQVGDNVELVSACNAKCAGPAGADVGPQHRLDTDSNYIALTIFSVTFLASPSNIMVLSR
jgi:hypothetical protein